MQRNMAKKKTAGSSPTSLTPSGTTSAPAARRRKSPATAIDQSTSEEVLATANEMAAATPAMSTEGLPGSASAGLLTDGPSYSEIADAAYRRYLERGGTHGQDLEDWISAERELRERRRQ